MSSPRLCLSSLAALLGVVLAPSSSDARGAGSDFWLLSNEGRLIRPLEAPRGGLDPAAELLIRVNLRNREEGQEQTLTATRLGSKEPLWAVPFPFPGEYSTRWSFTVPGVLVVIDHRPGTKLAGIDKATGKLLYRLSLGEYHLVQPYDGSYQWPTDTDPQVLDSAYAIRDLLDGRRIAGIRSLARLNLRAGKTVWERELPQEIGRELIPQAVMVRPGVIEGRSASYYFDPKTGEPLTKVSTDAARMSDLYCHGETIYHLSAGDPATLTAYEQGTQKALWSLEGLAGVRHLLPPLAHDRLLLGSASEMVVVDIKQKKVLSRFAVRDPRSAPVVQTAKAIVLSDQENVRAIEPTSGKTLWSHRLKGHGLPPVLAPDDQVLFVEEEGERSTSKHTVVAVSLKDGAIRWRWQVPNPERYADMFSVGVLPSQSGLIVQRSWIILE